MGSYASIEKHVYIPGRLIGAMRLVGVEGGNTNVPGIPGEGSAMYIKATQMESSHYISYNVTNEYA